MVHMIDSCPKFGWGFDGGHPMCKVCKRAPECVKLLKQDKMKQKIGCKPKILCVQPKRPPQVHVSSPIIEDGKWVQISIRFDLEWLRKHIESKDEKES